VDERRTAALLDLNYYLPCRVAAGQAEDGASTSRTIAVIGLGPPLAATSSPARTLKLLESLASYIGIAPPERQPLCAPGKSRSANSSG